MSSDSDTSSETSPTTRRWNKIEQELNDTEASSKEELRQKLRQKMMIKQTRRLSRFGQNQKLENMKQKMDLDAKKNEKENKGELSDTDDEDASLKDTVFNTKTEKELLSEKQEKKRLKNKKKKQGQKLRKEQLSVEGETTNTTDNNN